MKQKIFPVLKFKSLSGRSFSSGLQERLDYLFSKIYYLYPDKVVFRLFKHFPYLIAQIDAMLGFAKYDSFTDFFDDFGFKFYSNSCTKPYDGFRVRRDLNVSKLDDDNYLMDPQFDEDYRKPDNYKCFSDYTFDGVKIYSKNDYNIWALDDNIDVLDIPCDLYKKMVSTKYIKNVSDIILSTHGDLLSFGLTEDDIDFIYDGVGLYLDIARCRKDPFTYAERPNHLKNIKIEEYIPEKIQEKDVKEEPVEVEPQVSKGDSKQNTKKFVASYKKDIGEEYDVIVEILPLPYDVILLLKEHNIQTVRDLINKRYLFLQLQDEKEIEIARTILFALNKYIKEKTIPDSLLKESIEFDDVFALVKDKLYFPNTKKSIFDVDINYVGIPTFISKILYAGDVILLSDLLSIGVYGLSNLENLGDSKCLLIADAVEKYLNKNSFIDDEEHIENVCELELLRFVEKTHFDGCELEPLKQHLIKKYDENLISKVLDKCLEDGKIFLYDEGKLFYQYPTFAQYIYHMEKGQLKDILYSRLDGQTLEEISKRYGDSTTKIRLASIRYLDNEVLGLKDQPIKYFKEDRFKYIFETYYFNKEMFLETFGTKERTYNYLNMRYKKGSKTLEEAIDDLLIHPRLRSQIQKYVEKSYITLEGKRIPLQSIPLFNYYLSKHVLEPTAIDEVYNDFTTFIRQIVPEMADNILSLEALNHHELEIFKIEGRDHLIRYYNYADYDLNELIDAINLESYKDEFVTGNNLYNSNSFIVKQYDIRNGYELHCILRRYYRENPKDEVKFLTAPNIEVGNFDREGYIVGLLKDHGSLYESEIYSLMATDYNVSPSYIKNSGWLGFLDKYFDGNKYVIDFKVPSFSEEEINRIKEIMTEDFYDIKDLKAIYKRLFPDGDIEKCDYRNADSLGFNTDKRALVKKPLTVKSYFDNIFHQDIVNGEQVAGIRNYPAMCTAYYTLLKNLDLIKFNDKGDCININKLSTIGYNKAKLRQYADSAFKLGSEYDFFTLKSLRDEGFISDLDDLGFDDIFYESIIKSHKNLNNTLIGGCYVFSFQHKASLLSIVEMLLKEKKKIIVDDLFEYLQDHYGIVLDRNARYSFLRMTKDTNLYYDKIMETIYIDYDTYFEEI